MRTVIRIRYEIELLNKFIIEKDDDDINRSEEVVVGKILSLSESKELLKTLRSHFECSSEWSEETLECFEFSGDKLLKINAKHAKQSKITSFLN